MKVIFLDIDGVLINRAAMKAGFGKVDPQCVAQLNRILKETNAFVVVSSCWRIGRDVLEIMDLLADWGVECNLLDRTPHDWNVIRGVEIQWWLDSAVTKYGKIDSFVIIDDDSDMGELLPYLVRTTTEHGLTPEVADRVIHRLLN